MMLNERRTGMTNDRQTYLVLYLSDGGSIGRCFIDTPSGPVTVSMIEEWGKLIERQFGLRGVGVASFQPVAGFMSDLDEAPSAQPEGDADAS